MTTSESNPNSAVQNPKSEASRRDFLALVGRGALWATAGVSVVALLRYLSFTEAAPPQIFVLNEPNAYPFNSTTAVADGRAFIGHDAHGLYAINATCTHLGCLVKQSTAGFDCPCHGSRYTPSGSVTNGPATQPLNYSALSLDSSGKVVLDLSQIVAGDARLPIA
jgi:nitrite reductase/ring-hydroxylating ferredoxin subunit